MAPPRTAARLERSVMPTKVKICGIKTADAMRVALDECADYVGLVFFPPSPRNVPIAEAIPLAGMARGRAEIVALTVDADDALIEQIVAAINPDIVQLHGDETPLRAASVRRRFGVRVIKAIKVSTREDAARALDYVDAVDLVLFDAKPPKGADRPGGHGTVFDWNVLSGVKDRVPFMLSGGLTAANVAAAIAATEAMAVDVSSGVERAPGMKDPDLIRAFIRAARGARGSA